MTDGFFGFLARHTMAPADALELPLREAWDKCRPGYVPYGYEVDIGPCMRKVEDACMARCGGPPNDQ
jgi:hypothetical protein